MSNVGNSLVDNFFRGYGHRVVVEGDWDNVTVEDLYQMFKLRMELERDDSEAE
ncbi:hypothetical protein AB4Y43_01015 [Paraburkholderia sp. BR10872]|uniref:hypothetical protein n=1 Tax=Paraburkholderia sp. BR10872 TaxID=3236989 RepID=UPI0034D34E1F